MVHDDRKQLVIDVAQLDQQIEAQLTELETHTKCLIQMEMAQPSMIESLRRQQSSMLPDSLIHSCELQYGCIKLACWMIAKRKGERSLAKEDEKDRQLEELRRENKSLREARQREEEGGDA